ncbi:MAG: enolase C-terminal domain-like protein [Phycisphaerae bacterium]
MALCVRSVTLWRLAIPMRRRFEHAASSRNVSEPLMVAVELSDGTVGWGETHPRPYVSGETMESATRVIAEEWPGELAEVRGESFPEALERIDRLPYFDRDGTGCCAARAGVELGLIDAFSRGFGRSVAAAAGWLDLPQLGPPGSLEKVRYSGVIGGSAPGQVRRSLRMMRCYGLRDFKLKVGDAGDDARLRAAAAALERGLRSMALTLRLDANGGWTASTARARIEAWRGLPIESIEQPLPRGAEAEWAEIGAAAVCLMADESLVTPEDADRLIELGAARAFNVRLSKNGGLLPSIRLARRAARHGIWCQLGCMVGETSVLSAAGRWFLHLVPEVRFAEGSFGKLLLRGDVTRRPVRFGYGGRGAAPSGPGWGVEVERSRLERFSAASPRVIRL